MKESRAVSTRTQARILVIDDETAVLRVVAEGLEALGHRVWTADSGMRGLKLQGQIRPDVVICDLSMPEMDGLEVARTIRGNSERSGSPKPAFFMLTGWSDEQAEENTSTVGVDAILVKPITLSDLADEIDRFIHGTDGMPPSADTKDKRP